MVAKSTEIYIKQLKQAASFDISNDITEITEVRQANVLKIFK